MKKMHYLFLFTGLLVVLGSCQPSRQKTEKSITDLENRLFNDESGFTRAGADSLVQAYVNFAERFPGDSMTPEYLFKAATLVMNLNMGPRSIELFNTVREKYPSYEKAPLCLFFIGYVHENILGDIDKAREHYLLFIETYPDHDFVDDAQASLHNLGKTPEEMIREFEAMGAQASGEPGK